MTRCVCSFSGQHPAGRASSGARHGGDQEGVLCRRGEPGAADVPQQQRGAASLCHGRRKNRAGRLRLDQSHEVTLSLQGEQTFELNILSSRTRTTLLWSTLARTLKPPRPPCSSPSLSGSSRPTRSDNVVLSTPVVMMSSSFYCVRSVRFDSTFTCG